MAVEPVPIRRLVERVLDGTLRIPAFQRGFVWTPTGVANLMDSIYRQYPVGNLLIWRTREPLSKERKLGPFSLPDRRDEWPIDYVLDGQQRLTSLFGVFQTELVPDEEGDWFDIYFDLEAEEGALESQFIPLPQDQADPIRYFPLKTLFDTVAYRRATENYEDEIKQKIDAVQRKFQETLINVDVVDSPNREQVAIIFERINRMGVPLETFQLLSAWTWSQEFDLNESFAELAQEVEPYGFADIEEDSNLLLKCCAAVISEDASPSAIMALHGPTVRQRFKEVRSGIFGAVDFLKSDLNVSSLTVLPYPAMIVPLARFFADNSEIGHHPKAKARKELKRWFWRSCFSRRYSSGVGRAHATDISGMKNLRDDPTHVISNFHCDIDNGFFLSNQFSLSSVNTRTYVLLLSTLKPKSLLSGANVQIKKVLQKCNRTEFHHMFPRKFLTDEGIPKDKHGVLANLCFLSKADNLQISDKAPRVYKRLLPANSVDVIMKSHGAPPNALDLAYEAFLEARATLLVEQAETLIG